MIKSLLLNGVLIIAISFIGFNYYSSYIYWKKENNLLTVQLDNEKKALNETMKKIKEEKQKKDEKTDVINKTTDKCIDSYVPCSIYSRLYDSSKSFRTECIINK